MSFMMFPPEVNSSLMYSGAGSGPLMAAASAWSELAADLETTAASYQTVIAQLTGTTWLGPSSARMAAAAAPFVAWLESSSAQAAQTSAQAMLAAASYEGAFASTVPPAVIAANRALLAALVATNFLGQNTPAIAATEALYMEMWFQDGATMDTYATASQQAVVLPQQTPAPTTSDGGVSADSAAAAQSTATLGLRHRLVGHGPGVTFNERLDQRVNERLDQRAGRSWRTDEFGHPTRERVDFDRSGLCD